MQWRKPKTLASSIDGMLNLGLGFGEWIVDTRIAVLKSFAHNLKLRVTSITV